MKRSMWAIPAGAITAVLIGAAISAGPVMWAVLTLAAPLVVMLVFASTSVAHAGADTRQMTLGDRLGDDRLRREGRSDKHIRSDELSRELVGTPEVRRAARLRRSELVARAAAAEYAQEHADD